MTDASIYRSRQGVDGAISLSQETLQPQKHAALMNAFSLEYDDGVQVELLAFRIPQLAFSR